MLRSLRQRAFGSTKAWGSRVRVLGLRVLGLGLGFLLKCNDDPLSAKQRPPNRAYTVKRRPEDLEQNQAIGLKENR